MSFDAECKTTTSRPAKGSNAVRAVTARSAKREHVDGGHTN